jgi:hypothetical protein
MEKGMKVPGFCMKLFTENLGGVVVKGWETS